MKGIFASVLFVSITILSSQSYNVVQKDNQFITVDVNGQLENWYTDELNNSIQVNDKVVITDDMRLIRAN